MSWVDLAALTIMLWGSAKGYLLGFRQMVIQFCGLAAALLAAVFLQKPFSLYLNLEWQAETFFVRVASRFVDKTLNVGATSTVGYQLPPLAGAVMQRLAEEPKTVAVFSQAAGSQVAGEMMVRFLAVSFLFCFLAISVSLFLNKQLKSKDIPEAQRILGMITGLICGLLLSLLLCVLLEALSVFTASDFLGQDLSGSYLYLATTYFLALVLGEQ
ncbi:MAG: CvpA family protein [Firmicutes bacterium]|nr:CvpA family protein [Bacillota bacterium]MCL5992901.1 CvpA family protein [Bacillota bacterium]